MRKLPINSEPITNIENLFGNNATLKDTYLYPVVITKRPTTVNLYNVAVSTDNWTRVPTTGTTLSDVLSWKLRERDGEEFDYAFEASPTPYMTTFGELQRDTEISAIWVKRRGSVTLNMQLEVWK